MLVLDGVIINYMQAPTTFRERPVETVRKSNMKHAWAIRIFAVLIRC